MKSVIDLWGIVHDFPMIEVTSFRGVLTPAPRARSPSRRYLPEHRQYRPHNAFQSLRQTYHAARRQGGRSRFGEASSRWSCVGSSREPLPVNRRVPRSGPMPCRFRSLIAKGQACRDNLARLPRRIGLTSTFLFPGPTRLPGQSPAGSQNCSSGVCPFLYWRKSRRQAYPARICNPVQIGSQRERS